MSANLRVLQATPGYAPAYALGGPVQSLEGLDDHLASSGVHVRVLTTDSGGRERLRVAPGWSTWRGIPVRYVRRWMRPDVTPEYLPLALMEAHNASVVHVTGIFSVPSVQAMAAVIACDRPSVLSTRGALEGPALAYGPSSRKRSWLAVFGPLLRRATVFHATSKKEDQAIRTVFGESALVRIVPNGVDPPDASRSPRRVEEPVVGFMGRIHPVKALERLIHAAAILRARGAPIELRIAGPSPEPRYFEQLTNQVKRLSLEGVVRFEGEVRGDAKARFYEQCRVFVLPSSTENFGNVVPEALSHGVPVVASRFTPWAELEERRCGRWVDNSPEDLAAAVEPYLRDADLSIAEGDRGRALVQERYTWAAVARAMVEVYEEAIDVHRRGRHR